MNDLICRKSMARCPHPGMCSPHGGCQPDKTEWQSGYDEGRRMGTKHMYAEVDRLKAENDQLKNQEIELRAENEALRKNSDRYQWLRDKSEAAHQFYLSVPLWFTGVRFRPHDVDNAIDAMSKGDQP